MIGVFEVIGDLIDLSVSVKEGKRDGDFLLGVV